MINADAVIPSGRPEFALQRVFDAPRALVYKIWTQPEYVRQWWGVDGSTIVFCELDVREGGTFRIDMQAGDGTIYVNRGTYLDVVVNERIVSRDERDRGEALGTIPTGVHTVTFEDTGGKTLVTLTSRFDTIAERDLMVTYGMVDGIRQSLLRFERLVTTVLQERQEQ